MSRFLHALKLRILLGKRTVSYLSLVKIDFVSSFFGAVSPGGLGEDGARIFYIGKRMQSYGVSSCLALIDKTSGMWGQGFVILCAFVLDSGNTFGFHEKLLWGIAGAFALGVMAAAAIFLLFTVVYKGSSKTFRLFDRLVIRAPGLTEFIEDLKKHRHRFVVMMGPSLCLQFVAVASVVIASRAAGQPITFFHASVLFFVGLIAAYAPISFDGFGVMEGIFTEAYGYFFSHKEIGLIVSLVLRMSRLITALVGWVLFMKDGTQLAEVETVIADTQQGSARVDKHEAPIRPDEKQRCEMDMQHHAGSELDT